jgi:malate dehydrogenase (oxaloacetate-decarboxylating)
MTTNDSFKHLPLWKDRPVKTKLSGRLMLDNPFLNKGTCFTHDERHTFGLHGLLPTNVQNIDQQVTRAYQQYSSLPDDLSKNHFMTSMADQNTVLYYRLVQDHIKEMFSIIYTPTEGEAIENYSRSFRRPQGCYLPISHPEEVEERMSKFVVSDQDGNGIDYIVVSDGEEILGIGDQGIGGILISIAKLALTTICAGIHPNRTLPVVFDTGTDNENLLKDNLYLGLKQPRVRGQQYDQLVDNFIKTANKLFPNAYIHFEDFGVTNARRLLDRYRDETACFNDDIQGTGCVTLAAIMAALKISNTKLTDMRLVIFGSGSAGCGIAEQIQAAVAADSNKSKEATKRNIWCVDRQGLLLDNMELSIAQKPFARTASEWDSKDTKSLRSIIAEVKPHVLIGTSTKPGAFTKEVVEEMAKHVDRPIIFPLSNPTKLHEAQPGDINQWTKGRALIATGSPFPPVEYDGQEYEVAECNNSVCFPGIGLGAVLSRASRVSDKMLAEGVKALAAQSPALQDPNKGLVPDVDQAREVSVKIAMAVIRAAESEGLARTENIPEADDVLEEYVRAQMWEPTYKKFEKA